MRQLSTYFDNKKVLEFTVSWFLIEYNQLQPKYYFSPNTEPNLNYYLEKCLENSKQENNLSIIRLINCNFIQSL